MIVDSALYRKGGRVDVDCAPEDLHELRAEIADDGDFVWVGLHQPTEAELEDVAIAFGLHPLAVEDAFKAHQRPKLERYEDSLFLVLKTLWYVDEDDAVETGEINVFVGSRLRGHRAPRPRARSCSRPGSFLESDETRPQPRPVRGRVRRVRHRRRRLHRRRRRAADRRRRGRGVGLLPRPHQRLGADLHAQARDRRGAPGGDAAARPDAALRHRGGARDRRAGGAVLPRRRRPPRPGRRDRRDASTGCCRRRSTPTWRGSRCSRTTTCARSRQRSAWWPPRP